MIEVVKENRDKFLHAFNLIEGVGPVNFRKILDYFKSLEDAWQADLIEFARAGLEKQAIEGIKQNRIKINPEKEFEKIKQENIKILSLLDKNYPSLLKEIHSPPTLLYVRGNIIEEDRKSIGVVGTRKLSVYGRQITPGMVTHLASNGLTIVSGLARGIDTLSHKAALEAGGRTIAVLGSGVDDKSIYPAINKKLAQEISQKGAVVSEFTPGTTPVAGNFPRRNRIISGLTLGTLVVEAPVKSGALITARDALEQNREVFAAPGHIFSPNSKGPHKLIKMGAKLTEEAEDILEELNLPNKTSNKTKTVKPADKEEKIILEEIAKTDMPLHIDKIIQNTKLPTTTVNSKISLMEIRGKIRNLGAGKYSL